MYEVEGQVLHGRGPLLNMIVENRGPVQAGIEGLGFVPRATVPVVSTEAVLASEGQPALTCVTAALHAFLRGWLGF
jgi:hypothetical protein